jgi:hypothetical protein
VRVGGKAKGINNSIYALPSGFTFAFAFCLFLGLLGRYLIYKLLGGGYRDREEGTESRVI